MNVRFFSVSARCPAVEEATLNAFLASHRVLRVETRFVEDGEASYWAFAVECLESSTAGSRGPRAGGEKGERVDYRAVLSESDFAVFARLREVRKGLAEAAGVPPYAVFTNEQLAAMVTGKVGTLAALAAIEGVGPARVDRYGAAMLQVLLAVESRA